MSDPTERTGPADEAEHEYVEMNAEEWRDADLPNTVPSGETIRADRRDAASDHDADAVDLAANEAAPSGPVDPSVAEHYEEAIERGADVRGEGRI